jgi:hypothetical protein
MRCRYKRGIKCRFTTPYSDCISCFEDYKDWERYNERNDIRW